MRPTRRFILQVAGLVFAAGCAKVGDPLPPVVEIPDSTNEFEVVQQGGSELFLMCPPPPKNVESVQFYRNCDPSPDAELEQIGSARVESLTVTPAGTRLTYPVSDPDWKTPCTYAVRFKGRRGRLSEFSNRVTSQPGPVPDPPVNLAVEVRETDLVVTWDRPPDSPAPVVGYLVDFSRFASDPRHVITEFEFGREVTVTVQTVSRLQHPLVLSDPAPPLQVVPQDSFPPPVPRNLQAVPVSGGVQLVWDAVDSRDLAGYRIYRKTAAGAFELVAGEVGVSRYFDDTAPRDVRNTYTVSAVDRSGNESRWSAEASVGD